MKEQIEKKLGMSIEAYFDDFLNSLGKTSYETEEDSPLYSLSNEELDFLLDYIDKHGISENGWLRRAS